MATQDDIEILIEDDPKTSPTESAPEGVKKEDDKPTDKGPDLQQAIEKLNSDLTAEKSARAEAERRAAAAGSAAESRAKEVQDTNLALLNNSIDALKTAQDSNEAAYAAALAEGNFPESARIQRIMSQNESKLLQLESGKAYLEEEAKKPKAEPKPEPAVDPAEFRIRQLSPQSAAWARSHADYFRDDAAYQKIVRADARAYGEGLERDTPEYFAHVEKTLGIGSAAPRREAEAAPPPAAPSGGGRTPGEEGPRRNVVTLSKDEVEMAEMMGMTKEDYARNKVALKKEGKIA